MTISDCLKTPEKHIPYGLYCYHNSYVCPFWDCKKGIYPRQEDGFCHFLGKSDWELNEEYEKTTKVVRSADKESEGKPIKEIFGDTDIDIISGKRTHFIMSLLWDQCKECRINLEDPEDIELTTIEVKLTPETKKKLGL